MEISGKVVHVLPVQTGQGRNGTWKKQEIIVETRGPYARKVCLTLWGEKVEENQCLPGDHITASVHLESREHNGRWYTEVRAWKIAKHGASPTDTSSSASKDPYSPPVEPYDPPF
jgi:hypothetical protein